MNDNEVKQSVIQTISKTELARQIGRPELVLIDVRPPAAYNGWRLQGELRGGHIPGAISCALSWLEKGEPDSLKRLLADKGATPDQRLIVYGYGEEEARRSIEHLHTLGFEHIGMFPNGLAEWAADESLPMACLKRHQKLVHPEWVFQLINGGNVDSLTGRELAIFHVGYGDLEEYHRDHIPTAFPLDVSALESRLTLNRRSDSDLTAALLAHGISSRTPVLLYGKDSLADGPEGNSEKRAGQMAAMRAAVILMYAGVEDVRLLDGGYDAWIAAGYETEKVSRFPTPMKVFGAHLPTRPEIFIDIDVVRRLMSDPWGRLVSVRSWAEYVGKTSGYDYITAKGRIAGAVWGRAGSDAYHMQDYHNLDGTLRAYPEIESYWQTAGITPDKQVAFYCGTGWRASQAFFCAYLMGWERIAVYDGGWYEWSKDISNPVERGIPVRSDQWVASA